VQAVLPANSVVVNDAGNFSVFLHRQWRFTEPRTQAAPISGAMGYAVPGAVGAALARPHRQVLAVAGDGGFLMTAAELETAARLGVGIKVLVLQNGLYGTIAMHQARGGLPIDACGISGVDLAGLSRSLGATAVECDSEDQLGDAAAEFAKADGPAVMVVRTDPDVIAPGASLAALGGAA
jgi:acetolactate synthase-1/2/3 large subunit